MSETEIVAFGDSLARGTSAKLGVFHDCFQYESTTVNKVRDTQTWWSILQRILSDWVDGGVELIRAGPGGDTIGKALAHLNRDVVSQSPEYVLVMFGPEDALAGTDPEAFQNGLEKIAKPIRGGRHQAGVFDCSPFLGADDRPRLDPRRGSSAAGTVVPSRRDLTGPLVHEVCVRDRPASLFP